MRISRQVVGLLSLAAVVAVGFLLFQKGIYGWSLFVVVPMFLGGLGVFLFRPATPLRAAVYGAASVVVALLSVLFLGWDGLLCIAMALPIAAPLGAVGGLVVHSLRPSRVTKQARVTKPGVAVLLLLPPASVAWDVNAPPATYEVRSALEIAATPEQVWKHVVTFSELPEPREWFFHAGIAYPKRARIQGVGPGAIRYCEFSTGPFVEPIVVWDEPRLLKFRVTQNPAPLNEWSPYGKILPKHLDGYLTSRQGQFRLTRLPDDRTLLEGTTVYQHGLWPGEYWRWWSDAIIHRIHMRVLTHIRTLAEQEAVNFGKSAPATATKIGQPRKISFAKVQVSVPVSDKARVERRNEPRFDTQKTVILTLLEEDGAVLPALAMDVSGGGMRLLLNRPVRVGAAVKVEPGDAMALGEICYCEPGPSGFMVGIKLNQVLSNLDELAKLNRRLMGEESREKPAKPPDAFEKRPSLWIGGRSRR